VADEADPDLLDWADELERRHGGDAE
jgi:hypothetical protein